MRQAKLYESKCRGKATRNGHLRRSVLPVRAHSHMGDAAKIAGYCGKSEVLDEALAEFAESYADQTEKGHASLVQAIKQGQVKAMQE